LHIGDSLGIVERDWRPRIIVSDLSIRKAMLERGPQGAWRSSPIETITKDLRENNDPVSPVNRHAHFSYKPEIQPSLKKPRSKVSVFSHCPSLLRCPERLYSSEGAALNTGADGILRESRSKQGSQEERLSNGKGDGSVNPLDDSGGKKEEERFRVGRTTRRRAQLWPGRRRHQEDGRCGCGGRKSGP
jgi:hypothetical protein